MRTLFVLCALASLSAFAQKSPDLEKAQQLLAQRKYDLALKSIEAAEKKGGLDRDSYLTLLESKGLALASTGKNDKAEEAFRVLLSLDGKRDLAGKYAGKVGVPITAAQAWVKTNGLLELVALDPGAADGKVKQISFAVKNDPLGLVKTVRFYLKQDGGTWKPMDGALNNGAASLDTDADLVEWWAEAQDGLKNQLAFLGAAVRPVKNVAPAPVAVAKKDPEPVKPVEEPKKAEPTAAPAAAVDTSASRSSPARPIEYMVGGVGVAALITGMVLGATNTSAQSIRDDLAAGRGTQAELYTRDQARISTNIAANVLFIGGGVLAATGVVLFFVGADSSVAVGPMGPTGLAVSGTF